MQFAQIYQLVPLPSLFFIGKSGTPIEVVTGNTTSVEELDSKIKSILEKSGISEASSSLITSEQSASTSADIPLPVEKPVEKVKKPEISHEEKLQKAKELIEKTRRIKDAQEAEVGSIIIHSPLNNSLKLKSHNFRKGDKKRWNVVNKDKIHKILKNGRKIKK